MKLSIRWPGKNSPANLIANLVLVDCWAKGKGPLEQLFAPTDLWGISIWKDDRRPGYVNVLVPSRKNNGQEFNFIRGNTDDKNANGWAIQRLNATMLAVFLAHFPDHPYAEMVSATLAEHPGALREPLPDITKIPVELPDAKIQRPVVVAPPPSATPKAQATATPTAKTAPTTQPEAPEATKDADDEAVAQPAGRKRPQTKNAKTKKATETQPETPEATKAAKTKTPAAAPAPPSAPGTITNEQLQALLALGSQVQTIQDQLGKVLGPTA